MFLQFRGKTQSCETGVISAGFGSELIPEKAFPYLIQRKNMIRPDKISVSSFVGVYEKNNFFLDILTLIRYFLHYTIDCKFRMILNSNPGLRTDFGSELFKNIVHSWIRIHNTEKSFLIYLYEIKKTYTCWTSGLSRLLYKIVARKLIRIVERNV